MGDRVRIQFPVPDTISVSNLPASQGQLSLPSLRGR